MTAVEDESLFNAEHSPFKSLYVDLIEYNWTKEMTLTGDRIGISVRPIVDKMHVPIIWGGGVAAILKTGATITMVVVDDGKPVIHASMSMAQYRDEVERRKAEAGE